MRDLWVELEQHGLDCGIEGGKNGHSLSNKETPELSSDAR